MTLYRGKAPLRLVIQKSGRVALVPNQERRVRPCGLLAWVLVAGLWLALVVAELAGWLR